MIADSSSLLLSVNPIVWKSHDWFPISPNPALYCSSKRLGTVIGEGGSARKNLLGNL